MIIGPESAMIFAFGWTTVLAPIVISPTQKKFNNYYFKKNLLMSNYGTDLLAPTHCRQWLRPQSWHWSGSLRSSSLLLLLLFCNNQVFIRPVLYNSLQQRGRSIDDDLTVCVVLPVVCVHVTQRTLWTLCSGWITRWRLWLRATVFSWVFT